jgi:hypothetical protein
MDLLLMSTDHRLITGLCQPNGPKHRRIDGVVVDLETDAKADRQREALQLLGTDTTISTDRPEDLERVRNEVPRSTLLVCRTNGPSSRMGLDIEAAIDAGVDEVLVPMVRTAVDLAEVFRIVSDRVNVGIMIETNEAAANVKDLSKFPLSRVYVGLMDLAIERRSRSPFAALVDGTVEMLRHHISCSFGVAGLTIPSQGSPIPSRLIMAELTRLGCDFSVLRRSFMLHTQCLSPTALLDAVESIHQALSECASAPSLERERAHQQFLLAAQHSSTGETPTLTSGS